MSVYKDEERNTWYVSVRYSNWQGERKQKVKRGFGTRRDALAWERNFLQVQQADLSMIFDSFLEVYYADKEGRLKERWLTNKKYIIASKISPYFGSLPLNSIKPSDIINWQTAMMGNDYSETYLRKLQNQVTAVFNHAERFYGLKENPCRKTDKIGRSNARELSFWTYDEFMVFINSFGDDALMYRVLFGLLFWTGCRLGEALALTLADVDFAVGQMTVNKTFYRHKRKDIVTRPKTEKSNRVITLPEFLANDIKAYSGRIYGLGSADRLFPVTERAVQKKIVLKAEKAGVQRIRVHDLRHSHIALLIEKGVSPLVNRRACRA
jgi:integrase